MQWKCARGCLHPGVVLGERGGRGGGKRFPSRSGPDWALLLLRLSELSISFTQTLPVSAVDSVGAAPLDSALGMHFPWGKEGKSTLLSQAYNSAFLKIILHSLLSPAYITGFGEGAVTEGGWRPGLLMSSWNVRMKGGFMPSVFRLGALAVILPARQVERYHSAISFNFFL